MNTEIISTNPVVKAIATGNAPRAARLAAARGALPISQNDLLEVLTFLAHDDDAEIKNAALETFANQDNENLFTAVNSAEIAPSVLGFVAESKSFENRIYEAVITNIKTPDDSI
ncbi:MAG: hypothetical protein H7Z37_17910, partial [Pyrinomonadaceae bacterium]|nr:hypothetical protein [Pyrinomonadaceae bacterium]